MQSEKQVKMSYDEFEKVIQEVAFDCLHTQYSKVDRLKLFFSHIQNPCKTMYSTQNFTLEPRRERKMQTQPSSNNTSAVNLDSKISLALNTLKAKESISRDDSVSRIQTSGSNSQSTSRFYQTSKASDISMPKLDDPLLYSNPVLAMTSARSCALDLTQVDDITTITPGQEKIGTVHQMFMNLKKQKGQHKTNAQSNVAFLPKTGDEDDQELEEFMQLETEVQKTIEKSTASVTPQNDSANVAVKQKPKIQSTSQVPQKQNIDKKKSMQKYLNDDKSPKSRMVDKIKSSRKNSQSNLTQKVTGSRNRGTLQPRESSTKSDKKIGVKTFEIQHKSVEKRPTLNSIHSAMDISVAPSYLATSRRKQSGQMTFRNSDLAMVLKMEPETTRQSRQPSQKKILDVKVSKVNLAQLAQETPKRKQSPLIDKTPSSEIQETPCSVSKMDPLEAALTKEAKRKHQRLQMQQYYQKNKIALDKLANIVNARTEAAFKLIKAKSANYDRKKMATKLLAMRLQQSIKQRQYTTILKLIGFCQIQKQEMSVKVRRVLQGLIKLEHSKIGKQGDRNLLKAFLVIKHFNGRYIDDSL